jgi:pimeloyl-ACP methyl ester carboxylesterase
MTEFYTTEGRRIAYDVTGNGPLIVLSHGMGVDRSVYRFLVPKLVQAGFRVANTDMRGHGESEGGDYTAITRTDVARDLIALVKHLGGPAIIVGQSLSGGSATIAAAMAPDLVRGIVEIGPFTKTQKFYVGKLFTTRRYRRGMFLLGGTQMFRSLNLWLRYLDVAYPGKKPADWAEYKATLRARLSEGDRFAEFMKTGKSTPADAGAQLPNISCPALVIMGTQEPDFADPRAEADAIVAMMPAGLGSVAMIEGAGHYPHAQYPDEVAALVTDFAQAHAAV